MGNVASGEDEEIIGEGRMQTNMMRMMNDDVFDKYKVMEVLGSGSMGFVAKARIRNRALGGSAVRKKSVVDSMLPKAGKGITSKITNMIPGKRSSKITGVREEQALYALKSIQVDRVSELFLEELRNEIEILRGLDHPNIVRAYEVFMNKHQIYMVLELCDGGDLYARGPYSEKKACSVVGQLLSAIKYMHDHGIVHRDLKFENIMWENKDPDAQIKVIDFGLSKKFGYGEKDIMTEGVGTIYTMAPQVLQGVYTSQADLWSVGVISYMLLSSQRPFNGKKRKVVIDKIMRGDYTLSSKDWESISNEAKDFVKKLLELDPEVRSHATSALTHAWVSMKFEGESDKPCQELAKGVKKNLMMYQNSSKLKKIALNVIAHRSTSKEIMELRKVFDQYDKSKDGIIELHEFKAAMKGANLGFSEEEIENIFASIDIDNNGDIQYTEFLAAALEAKSSIEEERIAEAFDRLDSNNSGYISQANLMNFLGSDATAQDVKQLLDEWDTDKDGKISYEEFKKMFNQRKISSKNVIYDAIEDDEGDEVDDGLVGLDAKIPGGKFDVDK